MYYEKEYLVDSRDIDPWYHCRPSGLLGALQEAAVEAAFALHVSRDETMAKYHCFWMLVRMWYRLNRPLSWGDQVTIRTWHRGGWSAPPPTAGAAPGGTTPGRASRTPRAPG